MLLNIFGLALLVVFAFCFRTVSLQYRDSLEKSSAKSVTEQQMAARFIKNAITQYELRNTRPDLAIASRYETLTEEMDDLVEEYYLRLENFKDAGKVHSVGIHIVKAQ